MEDDAFTTSVTIFGGIAFLIGAIFGYNSLHVLIPLVFVVSFGLWLYDRRKHGKDSANIWAFLCVPIMVSLFLLVCVFLGNCLAKCTGSKSRAQVDVHLLCQPCLDIQKVETSHRGVSLEEMPFKCGDATM